MCEILSSDTVDNHVFLSRLLTAVKQWATLWTFPHWPTPLIMVFLHCPAWRSNHLMEYWGTQVICHPLLNFLYSMSQGFLTKQQGLLTTTASFTITVFFVVKYAILHWNGTFTKKSNTLDPFGRFPQGCLWGVSTIKRPPYTLVYVHGYREWGTTHFYVILQWLRALSPLPFPSIWQEDVVTPKNWKFRLFFKPVTKILKAP